MRFRRRPWPASGPTGEPVVTAYARHGDTAVVEMASISGLAQLPGGRLHALDNDGRLRNLTVTGTP
jgi:glycerate kinase